ncbi:MAG: NAD-dependent epimerase/dehydratase family protein [Gammaproteobacteria bacterium]
MKALVTGATGFIGSAVARTLIEKGHEVRVTVREGSDLTNVEALSAERVTADLADRDSLRAAVRGCDAVFHVAADYRLWTLDPDAMYRVNVDGSVHLLRAAADAGVERIVYTSSVATLGLNADRSPADEDTPSSLSDMVGHYKRSKFMAEAAVRNEAEERALPVVIVNPSAPVGPRDIKPTPTGQIILDAALGRMPAYMDTGLNVVHVDDVALGHVLALERGEVGRRYILGGTDMTLKDILAVVARLLGTRPPKVRLAPAVVYPIAVLNEAWSRLSRKPPRVPIDGVRMAKKHMFFRSDRAIHEIGYHARPAEEAIRDALEWFRSAGYVSS